MSAINRKLLVCYLGAYIFLNFIWRNNILLSINVLNHFCWNFLTIFFSSRDKIFIFFCFKVCDNSVMIYIEKFRFYIQKFLNWEV
jgi:hypothetical protein